MLVSPAVIFEGEKAMANVRAGDAFTVRSAEIAGTIEVPFSESGPAVKLATAAGAVAGTRTSTEKLQVSVAFSIPAVIVNSPLAKPMLDPVPHGFVGKLLAVAPDSQPSRLAEKRILLRLTAPLTELSIWNCKETVAPGVATLGENAIVKFGAFAAVTAMLACAFGIDTVVADNVAVPFLVVF